MRSTSVPSETLSTESRFTTDVRGSVDLTRTVAGEESAERLVDECGIRELEAHSPRGRKQLLVDWPERPAPRVSIPDRA